MQISEPPITGLLYLGAVLMFYLITTSAKGGLLRLIDNLLKPIADASGNVEETGRFENRVAEIARRVEREMME